MLSSLSFGSHHKCSCSTPPAGGPADGADTATRKKKNLLHGRPSSHPFHFRFALGFLALRLASMLDSLVRVSRRAGICHFTNDLRGERNIGLPPDREHPWFYPEGTPLEPAQTHASLLAIVIIATSLSPETSVDTQQRPISPTNALEERPRVPCPYLTVPPKDPTLVRSAPRNPKDPPSHDCTPNRNGTGIQPSKSLQGERYSPVTGKVRFPYNNFKFFSHSFQSAFHLSFTVLLRYRSCHSI